MAAITEVTPSGLGAKGGLLETIAITNQTAASTAVTKAVRVPSWARSAVFVISGLTLGGTTPTFDFILQAYNAAANGGAAPDDGFLMDVGGWDGITQKTSAAGTVTTIDVAIGLTNDDTGSATASDHYTINAPLPEWFVYKYTTTDSADDADYAAKISVYFRP